MASFLEVHIFAVSMAPSQHFHSLPENSYTFPLDFCRDDPYGKYPAFAAIKFRFCARLLPIAALVDQIQMRLELEHRLVDRRSDYGNNNDGKSSGGLQGFTVG
ncbi:Hypothetical predicted protein [Olea europaea subsp. europaea]|uniref:Uncharacterized protein n=1 Tax=Olea europaea subsp. europaea TaxID=158383 RepID=A0A8S0UKW2_OLEEU|nr:Hypothetical predicted protein [Olea europaea subsp. europaea]